MQEQYYVALSTMEKIGGVTARQLISYCGSIEDVFRFSKGKLLKIPQIGESLAQTIISQRESSLHKAEKIIETTQKENIKILPFHAKQYPQRLKNIYDAPFILYYKGTTDLDNPKTVAIVGTRQASNYGKQVTEELVKDLKKYNPLIVSGLAYGIDITAHRASLKENLSTVGVMANGLDMVYPAVHLKTAKQMLAQNGGLLSENTLGTKPDAMRFPARNRIIAGMADVLIVVEAKSKGGALITAEIANSYHKDVFAVAGSIHSETSRGCHNLIKKHKAVLLTDVNDIVELMNWDLKPNQQKQQKIHFSKLDLSEEERKIMLFLQENPDEEKVLDNMSWKLQIPISSLNAHLLNLEILGLVKSLPGKKFVVN